MSNKTNTYYKQCTYRMTIENGEKVETAWLPEKLAIIGKQIYFGKKLQENKQLWTITAVGEGRITEQYLLEHERDYKTQREASDI